MARPSYFLRRAFDGMRRTPLLQALAISTIGVSLSVLAVLMTGVHHVDRLATRWEGEGRLVAFLGDGASAEAAQAAARAVAGVAGVASVRVRTSEEARRDLEAALGDPSALEGIEADLLPTSVEIGLTGPADDAAVASITARLQQIPGLGEIARVDVGADLVARVRDVRDGVRLAGLVVGTLVVLAVIFIVSNTIRFTLLARREEIEILQLVGATPGFIRAPFYLEGAAQGAVGGLLAVALLHGLHRLLLEAQALPVVAGFGDVQLPPAAQLVALAAGTAVVGVVSSHFAVGRYLRGQAGG